MSSDAKTKPRPWPIETGNGSSREVASNGGGISQDAEPPSKDMYQQALTMYRQYCPTKETLARLKIPGAVLLLAIVASGNTQLFLYLVVARFLYPIYWLILRTIAVAVGVALGLGFATHVYDQLERWTAHGPRQHHHLFDRDQLMQRKPSTRKQETQALLMEHLRGSSTTGYDNSNQQPQSQSSLSPAAGGASASTIPSGRQLTKIAASGISNNHHKMDLMFHNSSYAALMASAGYDIDPDYKRGRVLDKGPAEPHYPFAEVPLERQTALKIMTEEWPTLPSVVVKEMSRFMELLMRDYVSSWYSMVDTGIPYPEPVPNSKKKEASKDEEDAEKDAKRPKYPKWMVFSTASHRPLPTLEHLYRSVAVVFGNLAHRVHDVNGFRLILLKWVKVIAHTFKVYRQLRKAILEKQQQESATLAAGKTGAGNSLVEDVRGSVGRAVRRTVHAVKSSTTGSSDSFGSVADESANNDESTTGAPVSDDFPTSDQQSGYQLVSEMAITREFLFTGKLHPAVTFGLEIPSLLFSDPSGQDCGTGADPGGADNDTDDNKKKDADQILEERLFKTKILEECELDYNRVLASRIVKLLLPRQDYGSPIVGALMTEIVGGCVLAPMMLCFSPDYLNDWVKMLTETAEETSTKEEDDEQGGLTTSASDASTPVNADGEPILRTWGEDEEDPSGGESNNTSAADGDRVVALEAIYDSDGGDEMGDLMDLSAREGLDVSELNKEAAEDLLGTGSDVQANDEVAADTPDAAGDDDNDDDDEDDDDIILEETTNAAAGVYSMISLLSEALMNLQRQLDLEDCRRNSRGGSGVEVDWDNPSCKKAVVRLVLVVEALILHGRRKTPLSVDGNNDLTSANFTQIMMDLTSDIEAFEKTYLQEKDSPEPSADGDASEEFSPESDSEDYEPTPSDLSTLRTLIAAWLHTGQTYRTVCTLVKARTAILRPFYHSRAFLRNAQTSVAFTRQLKALDGVDVMVDTVAILNSPRIDPTEETRPSLEKQEQPPSGTNSDNQQPEGEGTPRKKLGFKGLLDKGMQNLNDKKKAIGDKVNLKGSLKGRLPLGRNLSSESPKAGTTPESAVVQQTQSNRELSTSTATTSATSTASAVTSSATYSQMQQSLPSGIPRYLEHHRNEAFASSLRSERERRMQSWITSIQNDTEMIQVVCRVKGATPEDIAFHRELHHVARIFYAGTNLIGIRDAARSAATKKRGRLNSTDSGQSIGSDSQSPEVSLLTVEMACSRRRIEVPDDDSSFLLRAQSRPLSSMGVHRDTRNADKSYRGFAASFEEPAVLPGTNRYTGGRYVRRCQLRYYPSNRMASVAFLNDTRRLDQRKGRAHQPENPWARQAASVPFLSPDFLRERHLCQKWIPKGSTSRAQPGIMSSNVMEQADFTAAPRTGKALDFVYRMSLFESPMIDLGGKRFTVHDAASQGAHRADASALEMSDAALSAALLVIGRDYSYNLPNDEDSVASGVRNKVELGPDGYPIIWMKYSRKLQDGTTSTEIKPYRVSFIRAAMLITSTRQEAQLQCLIKCVKAGSAKSATKARTDAQLRPTLRLLDFARDRSREKQEKLLRDLKLGMNHIDREQLRRNALLSPRYPTEIRSIQVSIEKALPAKDANVRIPGNPQSTVYKIRCVAVVDLVAGEEIPSEILEPYLTQGGKPAVTYKESWVVYRPFRDFQTLHKHLKTQVASSESSGNAGSRLVGAAAAAFTAGAAQQGPRNRQRNALIPSLGQANKAGALGATQRAISKRMEVLDGYLHYLLSNGHMLSRSPELLMFIGAFYPLSPEVLVGKLPISTLNDPLGRAEMAREAMKFAPTPSPSRLGSTVNEGDESESNDAIARAEASQLGSDDPLLDPNEGTPQSKEKVVMKYQDIVNKIDKVPLGQVRNRLFELLSYQFGFENASFFRSRMLSALKTMSFAVTTPSEFRKMLYKLHLEQASADALAYWLNFGTETLWPDGVFYESSPALTPEEQKKLAETSRELLHSAFPDQLRTVLGQDLTRDGLDMLHEMMQNRLVMKSMFYMLFDLLWEEVFPEMKDVLSCGQALDIDFEEEE